MEDHELMGSFAAKDNRSAKKVVPTVKHGMGD